MATFAEQITDLTIPETAPLDDAGAPRIWWYNGVKQVKAPGSFYTKDAEFPQGLGEPWKVDTRFDNESGWSTPALRLAVLAYRGQPFRDPKDSEGRRDKSQTRQWALKWEPGMQIYNELLCLIEGYAGPVILCCDGLTGKAIAGKTGILKTYQSGLLAEASRIAKRQMPLWSFWLPISTKLASDGKFAYEDTGYGSFVTPPALHLGDSPLDTLFVGPDVIAQGADILNTAFRDWAKTIPAHRMPANVVEGEVVSHPQLAAPLRNAPQLVEEGDTY